MVVEMALQSIMKIMSEKKYSIILVEDEENLQEALKLNLELEGYGWAAATTAPMHWKYSKQEHFDLIILDVMLPEIDGISVCETIRLQDPDIPILILSARTAAPTVCSVLKGADGISKPFNLEELTCYAWISLSVKAGRSMASKP